jgi:hypothetical protein
MRNVARKLLVLVIALLPVAAAKASTAMKHCAGDDPRWAAPEWNDRDWQDGNTVPTRAGIHWVRFRFRVTGEVMRLIPGAPMRGISGLVNGAPVDSVFLAAPYSYEFFWDGRLLGGSGVVSETLEGEATGPLDKVILVPADLLGPGEHVVAMRLSSFHYRFPAAQITIGFLLSNAAGHYASEIRSPVSPLIGTGGALVVALLSALLFWLVDRWRPLLLCSLVSLALAVFYLLIAWRWIHPDPYDWFYPRLLLITWVMTIVAALFPWLLLEQFAPPRRAWWLAGLAPLLALAWSASPLYEIKALWLCRAMLAISLGITAWAVWRRRPGARFVLIGVVAGLLLVKADRRDFLDPTFFLIFGMLVLFVFATLGLQLRSDRRRAQQATLTAARLETELLKRNIQPHFLMNTLTTIMEVIEQEPKTAVTLIEALAGEFRILARVSGEKLIPLGQELELCRAHLHIMSLRRGISCALETANVDETSPVPPALFHTLVEGGLTHQLPRDGRLRFTLEAAYQPGLARYVLTVHGGNPPAPQPVREGTGLRYVKARLEESFAGRWTLAVGPVAVGWQSVIEIKHPPGESGAT